MDDDLGSRCDTRILRRGHRPDQVDPGDERRDAGHPVARSSGHRVLVVDRRPVDPDGDLAGGQVDRSEGAQARLDVVAGSGSRRRPGTGRPLRRALRTSARCQSAHCPFRYRSQPMSGDHPTAFGWWPSQWTAAEVAAGRVSRGAAWPWPATPSTGARAARTRAAGRWSSGRGARGARRGPLAGRR